jgi:protein-S-isoprenylcysteine O-methyltransferase Ste14
MNRAPQWRKGMTPAGHNGILMSALRAISTAMVVSALGFMTYACYLRYRDTGSLNALGVLVVNTVFVVMFITRRDATSVSSSAALWLIAFAGTVLPLFLRPAMAGVSAAVGNAVQLVGIICVTASILTLRRSFGIVPANRGICTRGLYDVVRHPLYASELLALGGFVIANPSAANICLWCADCGLQFARACAEERFLGDDPVYRQYRSRVKYRLIPLLI